MYLLFALLFPVALMTGTMLMERVEAPLRREAIGEQVVRFLETARPDEVETFVSEGFAPALDRYWQRQPQRRSARRVLRHTESTA